MARIFGFAVLAALTLGCGPAPIFPLATERVSPAPESPDATLRYVALGDSYTIGTSVGIDERWPNQLVAALARSGSASVTLDLVANLGVNGFTSRDAIDIELPQLEALRPGFVTLLVGVNDVVQGVSTDVFRSNAALILDNLLERVAPERILIVTTPDYTVTPSGGAFGDPEQQSAGIRTNNEILATLALARGIVLVDIYDLSLGAASDRSLVASDGLHPSGAQYALWVERILPAVEALLAR